MCNQFIVVVVDENGLTFCLTEDNNQNINLIMISNKFSVNSNQMSANLHF